MSQTSDILAALERGTAITPLQALYWWGCFRLAARIDDLRKRGVLVKTEIVEKRGKRFARYSL